MTKLIYLPGFNSGPQSEKAQYLSEVLRVTTTADYDSWNPHQGFHQISNLINSYPQQPLVLLGSSLGGFWAYHFARRLQCACVLINPCMAPEITLKPFLGPVKKMYSAEEGVLEQAHLDSYAQYRQAHLNLPLPTQCVVIHEQGDELIPYQESVVNFPPPAKLLTPEGGEHRFTHMSMLIDEIRALL